MADASQRMTSLHDLSRLVPGLTAALCEAPQALRVYAACEVLQSFVSQSHVIRSLPKSHVLDHNSHP